MELEDIDAQMEALTSSLGKIEEVTEPLTHELKAIELISESIKDEFEEKIRALKREMEVQLRVQAEAQEAKKELLRKLRDKKHSIQNKHWELERKRVEVQKYNESQAALLLVNERWEKMLMGVKWREWAKDHQIIAARQWAQEKRMILADDMGLGKTLEAIMGLDFIQAATAEASPDNPYEPDSYEAWEDGQTVTKYKDGVERPSGLRVLYICPSSLTRNVLEEFRDWAPHRSVVPIGNMPGAQRDFAFRIAKEHGEFVMILNYEAWRYNRTKLIQALIDQNFDTIILDEAHNFKDENTTVYEGVIDIITESKPGFVLPMTGTPILNKPEDLFPLMQITQPGKYWTKQSFLDRFCQQDWHGKWHFKAGGMTSLAKVLGKKYLRREEGDAGIVLPEQKVQFHDIDVDLEGWPEQAKARESMRENALVMLNKVDEFGNPMSIEAMAKIAVFTRLRQIETWPAGIELKDAEGNVVETLEVEESQKLDYALSGEHGLLYQILSNNRRCVVFSQFTAPLQELQKRIEAIGFKAALLTGAVKLEDRAAISRDFDRKHKVGEEFTYHVALCHYRVGGIGLNFTDATEMIILDEEWNPGKRDQAYKRIKRMGQEEKTTVHVLRMAKTIDDWLAEIMDQKEAMVEGFKKVTSPELMDYIQATNDSGLL